MTTYNGRSAQYIPGKEVPNREPAVSKFVVEKLYEVHRKRLIKIEPVVDCHIYIPSFLTNQSWKKNAERSRQLVIRRENQDIYNRIEKLEKEEGYFSKDRKAHVKRLEHKLKYLKKLKDHGRMVNVLKTQKENEHFLKRIERAVPQYSIKKCKEWYKHHEMFKEGRKTDPTGGHIMHTVDKKLLPRITRHESFDKGSMVSSFESLTHGKSLISESSKRRSKSGGAAGGASSSLLSLTTNPTVMVQPRYALSNMYGSGPGDAMRSRYENDGGEGKEVEEEESLEDEGDDQGYSYEQESYDEVPLKEQEETKSSRKKKDHKATVRSTEEMQDAEAKKAYSEKHIQKHDNLQAVNYTADDSDKILLNQRAFHLDFDGKNCIVKVYASSQYDDNVLVKVVSTNNTDQKVYVVQSLSIDKVYEIVNTESGVITTSSDGDDLQTMSALMIKMFKDADEDDSGSLTFNEFEKLMERVDLGISYQELRFIISEADDNDNGVVDYAEFVPLAVDLLQSFRARNRAKNISTEQDVLIDDEILRTISGTEMENIAQACIESIREFDPKKYGLVKYKDLKKILLLVGIPLGLHEHEISSLCQSMPLDQFGRVKYHSVNQTFLDSLMKVRFQSTKAAVLAARGSGLQNHLMERCKEEEERLRSKNVDQDIVREQGDVFVPLGLISQRQMINILSTSTKLSLSRLQVIVLMSEATILDGQINYFQFIPACAKAIELMFEPKALRQRAELIENTDLSSEALLNGLSADKFEQRLATLFKSVDIDHSGNLDQEEFFMCLQSLELQLTKGEMQALFDQADSNANKSITFDEFIRFFSHNLLNLEREKHLRQLHKHKKAERRKERKDGRMREIDTIDPALDEKDEEQLISPLILEMELMFAELDGRGTGVVSIEDMEEALSSYKVNKNNFLSDLVISVLHPTTTQGMVNYKDALAVCGDILHHKVTKDNIQVEHDEPLMKADARAALITDSSIEEIQLITAVLMVAYESERYSQVDEERKTVNFMDTICYPMTGLALYEAQLLVHKLLQRQEAIAPKTSVQEEPSTPLFDFSTEITTDEMFSIIQVVRKTCCMRGLLHKVDSSRFQRTRSDVFMMMEEELATIAYNRRSSIGQVHSSMNLKDAVTLMPISLWFKILERAPHLRLNRSQVISIFATCTCFDRLHENLYAERFADHAAIAITKIHQGEEHEKRIRVMRDASTHLVKTLSSMNAAVEDSKVLSYLGGWRIKDLEYYIRDEFMEAMEATKIEDGPVSTGEEGEETSAAVETGAGTGTGTEAGQEMVTIPSMKVHIHVPHTHIHVPHTVVKDLLKSIPRLKFDDLDTATVIAALPTELSWSDLVAPCVSTIRMYCKERFNSRRINLYTAADDKFAFQIMKDLSEKLLASVKISITNDAVSLKWAHEFDTNPKSSRTDMTDRVESEKDTNEDGSKVLFRGAKILQYQVLSVQKLEKIADVSDRTRRGSVEEWIKEDWTTLEVQLKISAAGDTILFSGIQLVANIVSVDSTVSIHEELPVRLPSIGLMDHQSAEDYIENLASMLYLKSFNGGVTVEIKDD